MQPETMRTTARACTITARLYRRHFLTPPIASPPTLLPATTRALSATCAGTGSGDRGDNVITPTGPPGTTSSLEQRHHHFLSLVGDHGRDGGGAVELHNLPGGLAELVVHNPATRGSLTGTMMRQLVRAVDALCPTNGRHDGVCGTDSQERLVDSAAVALAATATPPPTRGLVLRGVGDMFSSGANFDLCSTLLPTSERGVMMLRCMTDCLNTLRAAPFISVAVLNGPALGGGAELATAADFRVARCDNDNACVADGSRGSTGARVHDGQSVAAYMQFVHARVGASPGWGGLARLCSIVGRQHALWLLGTSERCHARRLLEIGLVDSLYACVADECPDMAAREAGLAFLSPFVHGQTYGDSVAAIKTAVHACSQPGGNGARAELDAFASRWASADNREALSKATAARVPP
eukprot:m.209287 g.209287  ORF g.209287 m.209287 type:complete len:410 (-) comp24532_c0_seq1:84-1313(-)